MRRSHEERLAKKQFKMGIVNRLTGLTPKERAHVMNQIVQSRYTIPFSKKDSLTMRTLYRWLREFQTADDAGEALLGKVRSDRSSFSSLSKEQKSALVKWRIENAYRSLEDLRDELLHHESTRSPPPPSTSTIGRFLRSQGLAREEMRIKKPEMKIRLAFEADYPQQIWMADTKGPDIYVINPQDLTKDIAAKPIAIIDDHSRFIVAIAYVITENEGAVMSLFCEAVLLYGIPEILYLDRGGPYMGKSLKRSASIIGCKVMHTAKRDAPAKGKIEKLLRTCHERFEHEMLSSKTHRISLAEYNNYLTAYIRQDYHRRAHSSTRQAPEERFSVYPPGLRRWITRDNLARIFLPLSRGVVSKTGLVRVNKSKYLVTDATLWGKKLEVRQEFTDFSKVYLWYEDRYYGEAFLYEEENDFLKRDELRELIKTPQEISIREFQNIPAYGRLERLLAQHREEMESLDMNDQLKHNKEKKEQTRALTLKNTDRNIPAVSGWPAFSADAFVYLMMKLLKRKFSPSERLSCHTLWNSLGTLNEGIVRKTVGRLLGEEHSTEDVKGYLEEIRLAMLTNQ